MAANDEINEMMVNMNIDNEEEDEHDGIFINAAYERKEMLKEEKFQKFYNYLVEIGTDQRQLRIKTLQHETYTLDTQMRRILKTKGDSYTNIWL
eukprot:Seg4667.5 transcript_id=Seg4667.5/GoldUCD/mRNA.D3Y31 product="hypothetical protein" pseudo=true protein_id=Seg4667.5/GoldUCD/D3Y31